MPKKIKVLQAIRQGKVGGGETHMLDLVQALDPLIFESIVLSFTEGPMVEKLRVGGYKTYVVPTERPFNARVWSEVKDILVKENIDIIHAHGTRAASNTFSSARSLGLPLIYTVHGWSFHQDQNSVVKFIRVLSERFLVSMATKTICVSQSNLEDGKSRFPMLKSQVILNGINLKKFNPDAEYPDVRSELGISKSDVIVGYIARITAQKDPLTFIRAISEIPASYNLKYLIIGDGDLKPQAMALAKSLNLGDRVFFDSFREDVPAVLRAIDIYCLPSLWEGLPIGVLEAMAMRKVVIASAIDGTKEIIADGQNGFLIPVQSPHTLAQVIIKLVNQPNERKKIGVAAGSSIKEGFTISKMAHEISKVYKEIIRS